MSTIQPLRLKETDCKQYCKLQMATEEIVLKFTMASCLHVFLGELFALRLDYSVVLLLNKCHSSLTNNSGHQLLRREG